MPPPARAPPPAAVKAVAPSIVSPPKEDGAAETLTSTVPSEINAPAVRHGDGKDDTGDALMSTPPSNITAPPAQHGDGKACQDQIERPESETTRGESSSLQSSFSEVNAPEHLDEKQVCFLAEEAFELRMIEADYCDVVSAKAKAKEVFSRIRHDFEAQAQEICAAKDVASLMKLEPPHHPHGSVGCSRLHLVWIVHRVHLDDPELVELDLSTVILPLADDEPRVVPKLFQSLRSNKHLTKLHADYTGLSGAQAAGLASALETNRALQVLTIQSNSFSETDLQAIFLAVSSNAGSALEELQCQNQLGVEQAGPETFRTVSDVLKRNTVLRRIGMKLTDVHWRDQINRALNRNAEARRKQRVKQAAERLRLGKAALPGGA